MIDLFYQHRVDPDVPIEDVAGAVPELAQQPWIARIPGTRRIEPLGENAGATQVALSADEVADLDATAARLGVQGNRYNETGMNMVGR